MARNRQEGSDVQDNFLSNNKYRTLPLLMTGTVQLLEGSPSIIITSAAAPQTLKLPTIKDGMWFQIQNPGASTVTVQDASAGAVGSIATTKSALYVAAPLPSTGVITWFQFLSA